MERTSIGLAWVLRNGQLLHEQSADRQTLTTHLVSNCQQCLMLTHLAHLPAAQRKNDWLGMKTSQWSLHVQHPLQALVALKFVF